MGRRVLSKGPQYASSGVFLKAQVSCMRVSELPTFQTTSDLVLLCMSLLALMFSISYLAQAAH